MISKIKSNILNKYKNNNIYKDYEKFIESSNLKTAKRYYEKSIQKYKYKKFQNLFGNILCYAPQDFDYELCIEYLYISADIYKKKEEYVKESKCYKQIIKILKNEKCYSKDQYLLITAYTHYAESLENINFKKSIKYYELICQIYEKSKNYQNLILYKRYLAELYKKKNQKLKAIEYYNQILKYYKENNIIEMISEIEENIDQLCPFEDIELKLLH